MRVKGPEILRCDAGGRNYHFLKLTAHGGLAGWSEFDEGFGSRGSARSSSGSPSGSPDKVHLTKPIYSELNSFTRPAAGDEVAERLRAIEKALLDAKARALGVPCHLRLGGKVRGRIGSIGRTARPRGSSIRASTSWR
jgi:L-alanine-DL-glutamate epimerase-like enolase superfamily enzyme